MQTGAYSNSRPSEHKTETNYSSFSPSAASFSSGTSVSFVTSTASVGVSKKRSLAEADSDDDDKPLVPAARSSRKHRKRSDSEHGQTGGLDGPSSRQVREKVWWEAALDRATPGSPVVSGANKYKQGRQYKKVADALHKQGNPKDRKYHMLYARACLAFAEHTALAINKTNEEWTQVERFVKFVHATISKEKQLLLEAALCGFLWAVVSKLQQQDVLPGLGLTDLKKQLHPLIRKAGSKLAQCSTLPISSVFVPHSPSDVPSPAGNESVLVGTEAHDTAPVSPATVISPVNFVGNTGLLNGAAQQADNIGLSLRQVQTFVKLADALELLRKACSGWSQCSEQLQSYFAEFLSSRSSFSSSAGGIAVDWEKEVSWSRFKEKFIPPGDLEWATSNPALFLSYMKSAFNFADVLSASCPPTQTASALSD
eukprot:gb/GEZN01007577.1/.p1 GENE.gb/GEZN01007577.1/~~gb/GEZN01007577.1/.p1  ORF type:complete len:467 (-),score=88.43 gb/GEZN01007577.1/:125-1402(-)